MKKGLDLFGDVGVEAVLEVLRQLHEQKVLEPRSAHQLSHSEKWAALPLFSVPQAKAEWNNQGLWMR
jgi:hypothetical protein